MYQHRGNAHPNPLVHLVLQLQKLVKGRLWVKILAAMFLGIATGILLSPKTGLVGEEAANIAGSWLALPGNVFLSLIQMIVVPLIFASVILGVASSEDMNHLRRVGFRIIIYFVLTTAIAVTIGITVTSVIQPGHFVEEGLLPSPEVTFPNEEAETIPGLSLPETVVKLIPANPLGSMVEGEMLQVVLFAIIIGFALVAINPRQAEPFLSLLESLQAVCMTIVSWAMLLAPFAVFGLLAQVTIKVGLDVLLGMAVYVVTVLLGLLIMLCFYLIIATSYGGVKPLAFLQAIREVQLLAFSTSSSAAVMPLSLKTAEEKLKIRPSISQFLIPLGATINMDGTALYQGAATVFLAQVFGIELSLFALFTIVVTAVGASIGTPSTPGVGIIILSMVLKSVGVPTAGIAMIIGVDRILDMSRTAINVTGDLTACLVMNRMLPVTTEEKATAEPDYFNDNVI